MSNSPDPQPVVIPPPPVGPADLRAVSAQLVALVRGLLSGAVIAGLDTGISLAKDGELNARSLGIGAAVAAVRWLLEGFVLDRKAPAQAGALGGQISEPAKAQIVADGIEALAPLVEQQADADELVDVEVDAILGRISEATRHAVREALASHLAEGDPVVGEVGTIGAGRIPAPVIRAAVKAAMPRSTPDSRKRVAEGLIEYVEAELG